MSGTGGMIPHHLLLQEFEHLQAKADQGCKQDRDRLFQHIRGLPPAERRVFLCSDLEALLLSAADRRELMVESNAESEVAVGILLRQQAWRDTACWFGILLSMVVLVMTLNGLFQLSAAFDQARTEGRVPLPYEQQIALKRINDIGAPAFIDVPSQELRQRIEIPREILDVWQRAQESGAEVPSDARERRSNKVKAIRDLLYVMASAEQQDRRNALDLLSDLLGTSSEKGMALKRLCRENVTIQK